MTIHPRRYSRDSNHAEIVAAFRELGCVWEDLGEPLDGIAGIWIPDPENPDRIIDWRQVMVEIKLPSGKRGGTSHSVLTPSQKQFFKRWPAQLRAVVRTVDDVRGLVEYEQRERRA